MKWLATAFLATVFAVLSFNAFVGNDLSQWKSSNKLIAMLTDGYVWLVSVIGYTPAAVVFALCACAIVVAAITDRQHSPKVL